MTYTNNVPQSNQQIATTQPLIQANFGFLQNAINQEHNFSTSSASSTYHKKASMPNMADPVSLPAGTNGMYYVKDGLPKFYDGTTASLINLFGNLKYGTGAANLTGTAVPATSVVTIVSAGLWTGLVSVLNSTDTEGQIIVFFSSGGTLNWAQLAGGAEADTSIELALDGSNNIQLKNTHSGAKNFKWQVFYAVGA